MATAMPLQVIVAQLGARMHYAVPRLLHEAGMLERLFTDSYTGNKPWLEAALGAVPAALRPRPLQRWLGRKETALPAEKVKSFDLLGLRFALRRARAKGPEALFRLWAEEARAFNARIALHGLGRAGIVWGYSSASVELFHWAKAMGKSCVLEQTILPARLQADLMAAEEERWPGWNSDPGLGDANAAHIARETEEWELADRIVAGSAFVVEGLVACGVPVEKCRVVPYGVDAGRFARRPRRRRAPGERLRVLFAGEVGLRKGAPYLLEALRRLGPERVEARFAGGLALVPERLAAYGEVATFLGPVPRQTMPELHAWADVFVLPSVFEGSATVTYEALMSGVPVVCTPGAGSIVRHGIDGLIVPAGSVGALEEALAGLASGRAVLDGAGLDHPFGSLEAYGRNLLGVLRELA